GTTRIASSVEVSVTPFAMIDRNISTSSRLRARRYYPDRRLRPLPRGGGRRAASGRCRAYGRNVGTCMFVPRAVNVAVAPFPVCAVYVSVASSSTPDWTAAVQATRFVRSVGGPGGKPASAGQMIWSTLPDRTSFQGAKPEHGRRRAGQPRPWPGARWLR